MSKKRRFAPLVLVAAVGCAAAVAFVTPRAHGGVIANSSAYKILYINEDAFRNWDFHCGNSSTCISPSNVDWPMMVLFYNNAEINLVKDNILSGFYPWGGTCATSQYARLNDGSGWNWDGDSGRKTICCPGGGSTAQHIRFYAAGTQYGHDRMYNTAWGFWIIASDHQDHNESQCPPLFGLGSSFGYSEDVTHNLWINWTQWLRRPGWENQQSWFNAQNNDFGDHHVRSDGRATVLWVS